MTGTLTHFNNPYKNTGMLKSSKMFIPSMHNVVSTWKMLPKCCFLRTLWAVRGLYGIVVKCTVANIFLLRIEVGVMTRGELHNLL